MLILTGPTAGRSAGIGGCRPDSAPAGTLNGRLLCRSSKKDRLRYIRFYILQSGTRLDISAAKLLGEELARSSGISIYSDSIHPNLIFIFVAYDAHVDFATMVGGFFSSNEKQSDLLRDIQQDVEKFQKSIEDKSLDLANLSSTTVLRNKDGKPVYLAVIVVKNATDSTWVGSNVLDRFMDALGLSFASTRAKSG